MHVTRGKLIQNSLFLKLSVCALSVTLCCVELEFYQIRAHILLRDNRRDKSWLYINARYRRKN